MTSHSRHARHLGEHHASQRQHATAPPAIAVYSSCPACAHQIGSPPEYAPGRHMSVGHSAHVPELVAIGWIVSYRDPDQPDVPDVVCPHYAALCPDD